MNRLLYFTLTFTSVYKWLLLLIMKMKQKFIFLFNTRNFLAAKQNGRKMLHLLVIKCSLFNFFPEILWENQITNPISWTELNHKLGELLPAYLLLMASMMILICLMVHYCWFRSVKPTDVLMALEKDKQWLDVFYDWQKTSLWFCQSTKLSMLNQGVKKKKMKYCRLRFFFFTFFFPVLYIVSLSTITYCSSVGPAEKEWLNVCRTYLDLSV